MNVDINGQWSWIKMDFLMGMVVHHVQIVVRGEAFRQMIMEILDVIFCGNRFRRYGNGGLRLGMIPSCPKCGGNASEI